MSKCRKIEFHVGIKPLLCVESSFGKSLGVNIAENSIQIFIITSNGYHGSIVSGVAKRRDKSLPSTTLLPGNERLA